MSASQKNTPIDRHSLPRTLPEGFDSVFIEQNNSRYADNFHQEYGILSEDQILP